MDFWWIFGGSPLLGVVVVKNAVVAVLFISCLAGAYLLGRSHSELKIVKEQVEVVKYVEKQKADIYSKPNASRNDLLKLMHNNKM